MKLIQWTAVSLNFICQALPASRPFLASLYRLRQTLTSQKRAIGHHRRISKETKEDMVVFQSFLEENAEEKVQTVPFLSKLKIFNDKIQLFADSARDLDLGMGCM